METGEVEQLTPGLISEGMGPLRGDSLLFVRGRQAQDEDGSLELILRHVDTGEEELLTDNDWNDYEMKWSPDGRHICWQSEEFGHYQSEILVMDLRTRRTWNLSASEGRDFGCSFTPDGRAVVYQSLRTGNVDLIIQPVAGGPAVNMTFYPGDDVLVGFVGRQGG
jgi:Tol biopolymer transport system component